MEGDAMAMCACGQPLHYSDPKLQALVQRFVDDLGPDVRVEIDGRAWMVPRHYIALHGLKGSELPTLGFPEVS